VTGRVYVFDTNTGQHLHTIRQPSGSHQVFGASLAYNNDSVLVSSPSFSIPFGPQIIGQADLFDGGTGELLRPLPNPEPRAREAFGTSLAVWGNHAIVGAIHDFPNDSPPEHEGAGRGWVFDKVTGQTLFTLENPRPDRPPPFFINDWFGYKVAANDDVIAVGAPLEDPNGFNAGGAAYVFDSSTGALRHTLWSPVFEERAEFGRSVSVTPGGHVLVGAPNASRDGSPLAGHAYLFDSVTGNLLLDIPNPDPAHLSGFAFSTAATDSRIFIGSPTDESVFVFETIPEPSSLVLAGSLLMTCLAIRHRRALAKRALRICKARGSF
jgi:hypothetical protein